LLAVLNEQRQVLAVNDAFLKMLGINDPGAVLGLRPGEVVKCVHAFELPGGCGTSRFCSTCGAAISIVASLAGETPQERKCALTTDKGGKKSDISLRVRSFLVTFEGRKLVLLFLQDITALQRWAALERVFFHDISNLITALHGAAEIACLADAPQARDMGQSVRHMASRLLDEVTIQKTLLHDDLADYQVAPRELTAQEVVEDARRMFAAHPVAKGKRLNVPHEIPDTRFQSDPHLLSRVLVNMLTNAFEATDAGGEVKLWVEDGKDAITFHVWNGKAIPADVARRVFQRHFTTKQELGRGLGTYGMKLFGEQFLGGTVSFTSSETDGTVFCLRLPA
jgi:signal transduction histidine kinase